MLPTNTIPTLILLALALGPAACGTDEPTGPETEQAQAPSVGARFVPVLEAGTVSGINVYDVDADGIAVELGLQDADRIVAVDGGPIVSVEQVRGLLEKLEQGERPELVVERDEERLVLAAAGEA